MHPPRTFYEGTLLDPLGNRIAVVADDQAVVGIGRWHARRSLLHLLKAWWPCQVIAERDHRLVRAAIEQLEEYFRGQRRRFDLPLHFRGTPFQLAVWEELRKIPYGETRSYREIAVAVGRPKAARAVGQANAANPIAIVVPCHRVIRADGSLGGYGGGGRLKQFLLDLERSVMATRRPDPSGR